MTTHAEFYLSPKNRDKYMPGAAEKVDRGNMDDQVAAMAAGREAGFPEVGNKRAVGRISTRQQFRKEHG